MPTVSVSPKGTLATESTFVELFRSKPPCTLNYMTKDAKQQQWKKQEPTCLSFSSFPTILKRDVVKYAAGDHVALSYDSADSFFSVAVVRCDTWSVQWAISNTDCLHNAEIQQLVMPNADVVCGVYQHNKSSGLFLASRHSIATVSKQENRVDRSYMAQPRSVTRSFDANDIITVAAGSADKLFVLSNKGTVFMVDIGAEVLRSTDAIAAGTKVLTRALKNVKKSSKLVVSHVDEFTHVLVFSPDDTSFEVITAKTASLSEATCTAFCATVQTANSIVNVEMAGPYHVVATYSDPAIQFFTVLPGEAGSDVTPLTVMPLSYTPVATTYNATEQSHTLLCLPSAAKERQEPLVNALVSAVLPFSEGPYTHDTLKRAQWAPLPNTFKHYGMSDNQQGEEASLGELMRGDLLQLQNAGSSDGTWVPFHMFYVLANTKDAVVNMALFSVKAGASVHARLAKQWHNATTGLHAFMTQAGELSRALSMPWNPRHLRRALRLMSSEQLAQTFHAVAECLQATMTTDAAVHYKDAATAALSVALHITTLSNQIGVAIDPKDVEIVASLLRASRETGHEMTRYAGRMELQLDACLQRRSMRRLLASHMQSGAGDDEQLASLQRDFFGIPADLQVERTLLTRFAANSWAQYLGEEEAEHCRIAAKAAAYLHQVEGIVSHQGTTTASVLCNWEDKGKRPCGDKLMNEFESTLVHINQ